MHSLYSQNKCYEEALVPPWSSLSPQTELAETGWQCLWEYSLQQCEIDFYILPVF